MIFIRPCRAILIPVDANARIIPQRLYSWSSIAASPFFAHLSAEYALLTVFCFALVLWQLGLLPHAVIIHLLQNCIRKRNERSHEFWAMCRAVSHPDPRVKRRSSICTQCSQVAEMPEAMVGKQSRAGHHGGCQNRKTSLTLLCLFFLFFFCFFFFVVVGSCTPPCMASTLSAFVLNMVVDFAHTPPPL
jgi:hypothetical protein